MVALAAPASAQLGVDGAVEGAADTAVDDGVSGAVGGSGAVDGSVDGVDDGVSGTVDGAVDATAVGTSLDLSGEVSALVPTRAAIEAEAAAWDALDEADRAAVEAEARASGLWGHFEAEGAARAGEFASVAVDAADAALRGHAVASAGGDVRFLDGVDLDAAGGAEVGTAEVFDTGESVILWADGVRVEARNRADGSIVVQAAREPVDLTIDLAAGTDAVTEGSGWVRLTSAGHDAGLSIAGDGELDTSAAARGTVSVHLEPWAQLRFEAREEHESEDDFEQEQDARQEGRVGASARIASIDGAIQAELDALSVDLATSGRDNEVVVTVSSDDHRPRIVEVDLDADLFAAASRVGMTFDGAPAVRANSAAQVYAGDHAETTYSLAQADGHYSAVVWVEGFSTHELAFHGEDGGATGASGDQAGANGSAGAASRDDGGLVEVGAPGPALPLVALAVLVAVAVVRRRR